MSPQLKYYKPDTKQCITSCPINNYYADLINFICKNCDKSCLTCKGDTNNDCLTCDESIYYLFEFKCLLNCPENTFPINKPQKICEACHINC